MWALLPVKRLATGKSRLAAVLSNAYRTELMCRMLEDVLNALQRARCVERIIVLSNERGIDKILRAAGVERRPEAEEGDLNRSLTAAVAGLPTSTGRVLILPADIPAVRAADIEALSQAHGAGIVLCPAAVDGGTNALLSSWPLVISLQFGTASLARHLADARSKGLAAELAWRHRLARDMDRPCDLEWLANSSCSGRAASYVRQLLPRPAELRAG